MDKQTDEQYLDQLMARARCEMDTTPGFRDFVLDVMAVIGERPRPGDLHSMHMAYKAGLAYGKGESDATR